MSAAGHSCMKLRPVIVNLPFPRRALVANQITWRETCRNAPYSTERPTQISVESKSGLRGKQSATARPISYTSLPPTTRPMNWFIPRHLTIYIVFSWTISLTWGYEAYIYVLVLTSLFRIVTRRRAWLFGIQNPAGARNVSFFFFLKMRICHVSFLKTGRLTVRNLKLLVMLCLKRKRKNRKMEQILSRKKKNFTLI